MDVSGSPFAASILLAGAYLFSSWFSRCEASKKLWERRRWISAAAGISVAYVFVDVLPELGSQQRAFAQATGNAAFFFVQERMYALALASFVLFYGLDHMVLSKREQRRDAADTSERDPVYWLHLIGFATYSGLIGYLLVERAERGLPALAAYTVAMAVHFVIVGHSLVEEHGLQHRWSGEWLLALSVLAGCLLGSTTHLSETMFARLFAVLAGGVLITSLRHELPGDRQGRFWPFSLGAIFFALALFASEAAAA
jgi:hypothetical protein